MALSNAEKLRRHRERKKEERKKAQELTRPFLKTPFYKVAEDDGDWLGLEMVFDLMGIELPEFEDDSGPNPLTDSFERETLKAFDGSIGRAELMVDCLIDAGSILAGVINRYKLREINARIAEIEATDLANPAEKQKALADIVTLNKLRDRLQRERRRVYPEYIVKEG